jgi:predicted nuclease of restriction endonuclease-like (RecB) superfamily
MDEKLQDTHNEVIPDFFDGIAKVVEQARTHIERSVNVVMCVTYYEVGRLIVEQEQSGANRAAYGKRLLDELSVYLTLRCGKGWSVANLKNARQFYQVYSLSIRQSVISESDKVQSMTDFFTLSWTHYLILMRIENAQIRHFYEIEAVNQQWSVRQLKRQIDSSLYERLALSRNKDEVMRLALEGQMIEKPRDMLKNPLVLEFLNLEQDPLYSESDLESAIIANLQKFLLELGKGFLFEARQKRFSFAKKRTITLSN